MDLRVLNASFVAIGIVDSVESFIWTERYHNFGEFEIYTKFSLDLLSLFQNGHYLINKLSDRTMIIDTVQIKTDPEQGDKLVIKGRSLESLLDRRIILRQIIWDGSLQDGIEEMLTQNVIDGLYPERNFSNFIFSASVDPLVTDLTLKRQYWHEGLYDTIQSLCEEEDIGFKIVVNSSDQFVFSLYAGVDRSYNQILNPYVIFSPDFDNLIKSDYFSSTRYKKNYFLVSGDRSTGLPERVQGWTPDLPGMPGIYRREMYVDASYLSRFLEDVETEITLEEYRDQLEKIGFSELAKNIDLFLFDGQVDLSKTYSYGQDFFLGDIIQMVDAYGHSGTTRITEMTFSENLSGSSVYPTLKTI